LDKKFWQTNLTYGQGETLLQRFDAIIQFIRAGHTQLSIAAKIHRDRELIKANIHKEELKLKDKLCL
jgi:hypothetical protein